MFTYDIWFIIYACIMVITEEQYIKGIRSGYNDPTEQNGDNVCCKICDKDALPFEDYCEDHQPCYYCGQIKNCTDEKCE